jgi:23S rRNA (uracil1939-C5)-methyltransferase
VTAPVAGSEVELSIDALAAGGDGVGRVAGLVVFTPRTAPGDRVRVRLREVRRRFARAEVVEILAPGPARRPAPCPWFGACGGCDWLHLDEAAQREARAAILRDALLRIGGFGSLPAVEHLPSPASLGYRARARVAYARGRVGFRARHSHDVVDVARCAVLDPPTQEALARLRAAPPAGAGEVEIRGFQSPVRVGERDLAVGPGAFFQANRALWEPWRDLVLEACGRGRLAVELYAGVGFFTSGLDRRFERVVAVERGPAARDARRNARAEIVEAAAEDWAPRELEALAPDLVLLDPPRTGCHSSVSGAIAAAKPPRVVYVSCDPATLARDLRPLRGGHRIARLVAIDALPQTHHVEALCALEVDTSPSSEIGSPAIEG